MEIKVGKYTFVITETVDSWNGIITNINYKIGGNIRDCVNISVQFENNKAVSASMPYIEECSLYEPLGRGDGSIIMINTILRHIKKLHPQLKMIKFDDMSSIECATDEELKTKSRKKGTNLVPMPLYFLSIAYNGQTWYEKYFNAVQEDTVKQNAYRSRVEKILHNPSEKPDYIKFLTITKAPMNIRAQLETYFKSSSTYSDFFIQFQKNTDAVF